MKRISPATVTFGVMAIVLGLVAAYIVRQSMRKPVAAPPPPAVRPAPPPMGAVVIAKSNLPVNSQVALADLIVVPVPAEHPSIKTSIPRLETAIGRIVNRAIKAGQVVREEYLLGIGETLPDLADRLPEGHRALTVQVTGATTGGKVLTEGDYVDVAWTLKGNHPDLGEVQTRTLMRRVLVVDAFANEPLRTARGGLMTRAQGPSMSALTLAVTEKDANRLIVCEQKGTLSVTLCSAKDANAVEDDTTANFDEIAGLPPIPGPPPPKQPDPPPPPPRKFRIENFSGGSRSIVEFGEEQLLEDEKNAKYFTPSVITEPTSKEDKDDDKRAVRRQVSPFARAAGTN